MYIHFWDKGIAGDSRKKKVGGGSEVRVFLCFSNGPLVARQGRVKTDYVKSFRAWLQCPILEVIWVPPVVHFVAACAE